MSISPDTKKQIEAIEQKNGGKNTQRDDLRELAKNSGKIFSAVSNSRKKILNAA